jgi:hypothetical protein
MSRRADESLRNPAAGGRRARNMQQGRGDAKYEAASSHAHSRNQMLRDPQRLPLSDPQSDQRPSWIDASKGRVFRSLISMQDIEVQIRTTAIGKLAN